MNLAPSETSLNIPAAIEEIKSPELDYDVKSLIHQQTYYQSIQPRNGNPEHTVLRNTHTETRFHIEKGVYNFSEFVLQFKAIAPNTAAGHRTHVFGSVPPIQSIVVRGQSNNAVILDLADANIYGAQIAKYETPRMDYLSRSDRDILYPSNKLASENSRYEAKVIVPPATGVAQVIRHVVNDGVKGAVGAAHTDWHANMTWPTFGNLNIAATPVHGVSDVPAFINYLEHQYVSKTIAPNTADAELMNKSFRLGDVFKNSFLSMDKIFPATEALEMIIRWCPSSGFAFESPSATDYDTNARDMSVDIKLTGLTLHMAQEQPGTHVYNKCIEMVESGDGLVLQVPLITAQEGTVPSATQTTVPFYLNNGMGGKVSKIIVVPMINGPTGNLRYDFDNTDGKKIEHYWSKFNNKPLQPAQVDVTTTDLDFQQNRKRLKDSPLANFNAFRYNWAIVEDFSGFGNTPHKDFTEDSMYVGREATSRDTYSISLKAMAQLQLKCFFIGTQRVHITRNGIFLLA